MTGRWWPCPNNPPCPHGVILHDVEEYSGDGTDICCADDCDCRGPSARPIVGRQVDSGAVREERKP